MNIKIGYPDEWGSYLDNANIKSKADGGSYFENIIEIAKASKNELLSCQGTSVDKTVWNMYPIRNWRLFTYNQIMIFRKAYT